MAKVIIEFAFHVYPKTKNVLMGKSIIAIGGGKGYGAAIIYGPHKMYIHDGTNNSNVTKETLSATALMTALIQLKRPVDLEIHMLPINMEVATRLNICRAGQLVENQNILKEALKILDQQKSFVFKAVHSFTQPVEELAKRESQYHSGDMYWCDWCGEYPSSPNEPCGTCDQLGANVQDVPERYPLF